MATVVTACAFTLPLASDARADGLFSTYTCYNGSYNYLPKAQIIASDSAERKALKQSYTNLKKELDVICKKAGNKADGVLLTTQSDFEKALKDLGIYDTYTKKLAQLGSVVKQIQDIPTPKNDCGANYPYGCPKGLECYEVNAETSNVRGGGMNVRISSTESKTFECHDPKTVKNNSALTHKEDYTKATEGQKKGSIFKADGGTGVTTETLVDTSGRMSSTTTAAGLYDFAKSEDEGFNGNDFDEYEGDARSNAGFCDISALKSDYMSNCYSCVVVGNLIKTFMSISAVTYPVAQEAGVKLLVIGMMIWLAFYVLQKLSSFVSLEPMKMLQELFSFFFKCLIAYVLMTSGLRNITDLIVDPILKAGADYGISIINSVSNDLLEKTEIVERTKDDAPYQAEPVQNKEQAKEVEKETGNKVTGEVHTGKYRPEDISKTKESGMDYCCWGDERDNGYHAFGAHQLDFFAGGAADFAISCKDTNKEIYDAYVSAGKKSGTALRSALTPIFKRMCNSASGKAELKKLQDSYYIAKYKSIFAYAKKHLGIDFTLSDASNPNSYANPKNFTLAAALISGQIHNPKAIRNVIDSIAAKSGSCASRSCDMNAIAQQVYAGLKSKLGFTKRYGTGKDSELALCQTVLAGGDIDTSVLEGAYGSSGSETYDYRQTDHYYIVKKGDQDFDLVPISKEDNQAVLDTTVFEKIMLISRKADNAVSLNFVIGDALVCHSTHAGAIQFAKKVTDLIGLEFYFPDVWIWLCGAVIWVFALMVTLAVNFYLLDLSFKIGFALLALPITIGLWPFKKFEDKFKVCVRIIANAAGTFMFLGITTGLSIVLISTSLGGTDALFEAIENDRKEYISNTFSLTGGKFFLILFAFLYSHKMISGTVSKLADQFFPSVTNGLTPMHHMTTQMIDMGVSAVKTVASGVAGAVTGGATTVAKTAAKTAVRQAVKGIRRGISKGGSGVKKMLGGK